MNSNRQSFFFLLGFVVFLVCIFIVSFFFLLEFRKVATQKITAWDKAYEADCAVALTGGAGRVREGFDLLARGSIKKLIISGVNIKVSLRDIFPQWPFYGHLNTKDVILEKRSKSTYENATETKKITKELNCGSLLLITSYIHIYRAERVFKKIFPSNYLIYSLAVAPQSSHVSIEKYLLETFKSLFYSLWAY